MKKIPKKANHELQGNQFEKNSEPGKDYAHYPPASAEQVKPAAHKNHAADKGGKVDNVVVRPINTNGKKTTEKVVNESDKIVNAVDESYSDGSGGGFEATEQVND